MLKQFLLGFFISTKPKCSFAKYLSFVFYGSVKTCGYCFFTRIMCTITTYYNQIRSFQLSKERLLKNIQSNQFLLLPQLSAAWEVLDDNLLQNSISERDRKYPVRAGESFQCGVGIKLFFFQLILATSSVPQLISQKTL